VTKIVALVGLLCVPAAGHAGPASPPRGVAPLRLDCAGDPALCAEAATCGDCHPDQYDQWKTSRHRNAWSNATFQHGFARDPKRFCFHCHAPLETEWRRFATQRTDAHSEGINCQVCHLAPLGPGESASRTDDHPVRPLAALRDPAFCAGCHEFNLVNTRGGELIPSDLPLQETYTEWSRYRAAGGQETCQSCHMPGGDHRFRGAHDLDFFRGALTFGLTRSKGGWRLALTNTGVGHNLPTGDIFRELVVERVDPGGETERLAVFRRTFGVRHDPKTERFEKVLLENASLRPFQKAEIALPADARGTVRVVYHWAGAAADVEPPVVLFERALAHPER
jgi:hypothetical protein